MARIEFPNDAVDVRAQVHVLHTDRCMTDTTQRISVLTKANYYQFLRKGMPWRKVSLTVSASEKAAS